MHLSHHFFQYHFVIFSGDIIKDKENERSMDKEDAKGNLQNANHDEQNDGNSTDTNLGVTEKSHEETSGNNTAGFGGARIVEENEFRCLHEECALVPPFPDLKSSLKHHKLVHPQKPKRIHTPKKKQ